MTNRLKGLDRASREVRAAFAAACAERVLIIFEIEMGESKQAPRQAVELTWQVALGADADNETVLAAREAVGDEMPDQDDEPGTTDALYAGQAAARALDATGDPKSDAARATASFARDAVEYFDGPPGAEEEAAWQERALSVAMSWGKRPVERDMFAAAGVEKPAWLARQGR